MTKTKQSKREQFLSGYSGKELVKKHSLTEEGFWKIRGADDNCDFGGHHYQADLGTYEGKLTDIVDYAVQLSGFWSWDSGDIAKVRQPMKITAESTVQRNKLIQEKEDLEARLKEISTELKGV